MIDDIKNKDLLTLAKDVFKNTKAYKDFLTSKGIKTLRKFPSRFDDLPLMNKSNYIEKYGVEKRLLGSKKLSDYYMICTSSGSTGEPTIWPRNYDFDAKAIDFNYSMYKDLFNVDKKNTLVVVTFGLGAWTAGMLTSRLCWEISKNVKLSVVTPGLDKEVTLRVIKQLSKYFDQTIITGYPPFIIDLIEYGHQNGFNFKKINTKIHFTSARLLENQRVELSKLVSKTGSVKDILGFYASSEAGIIGIETPETVDILTSASKNKEFCLKLFNNPIPPSFITYNPKTRFIEVKNGTLLLTVNQPVPLIRYDTKDRGGIFDGRYLSNICKEFGYQCPAALTKSNFAYVFGRADAVRLLSNIYIEDVLYCLKKSNINVKLTSNFKYGLVEAGLRNVLKIIVYVKHGRSINRKEKLHFIKQFVKDLETINPDFKMVNTGINFKYEITFLEETGNEYEGGKFNYHL